MSMVSVTAPLALNALSEFNPQNAEALKRRSGERVLVRPGNFIIPHKCQRHSSTTEPEVLQPS